MELHGARVALASSARTQSPVQLRPAPTSSHWVRQTSVPRRTSRDDSPYRRLRLSFLDGQPGTPGCGGARASCSSFAIAVWADGPPEDWKAARRSSATPSPRWVWRRCAGRRSRASGRCSRVPMAIFVTLGRYIEARHGAGAAPNTEDIRPGAWRHVWRRNTPSPTGYGCPRAGRWIRWSPAASQRVRIDVLEQGVDLARFRPGRVRPAYGPLRVVYVGSLDLRKGFIYLLEGIRKLGTKQVTLRDRGSDGEPLLPPPTRGWKPGPRCPLCAGQSTPRATARRALRPSESWRTDHPLPSPRRWPAAYRCWSPGAAALRDGSEQVRRVGCRRAKRGRHRRCARGGAPAARRSRRYGTPRSSRHGATCRPGGLRGRDG